MCRNTTGGRDDGGSRANDGRLAVSLSVPGTPGAGTNPEQLFAAGWSSCFLSAVKIVAGKRKIALPDDVEIDAEVDLGLSRDAYGLAARLNVYLHGVDEETARELVEAASHTCPNSLATKGNIDVHYNAIIYRLPVWEHKAVSRQRIFLVCRTESDRLTHGVSLR